MAKYYYEKYNLKYIAGDSEYSGDTYDMGLIVYPSYSFSESSGYSVVGVGETLYSYDIDTVSYRVSGNTLLMYVRKKEGTQGYASRFTATATIAKGSFIEIVIAEDGTYPNNGAYTDGYWYIKKGLAFPELKMKIDGQLKASENGWVKVDNQLKTIDKMWTKVDGQLKEV